MKEVATAQVSDLFGDVLFPKYSSSEMDTEVTKEWDTIQDIILGREGHSYQIRWILWTGAVSDTYCNKRAVYLQAREEFQTVDLVEFKVNNVIKHKVAPFTTKDTARRC